MSAILDGASSACDAVVMHIDAAWNDVIEFGDWMGRKVKEKTDRALPKPLNLIVQRAFNSLPIILAWQLLPGIVTLPVALLFFAVHLVDDNPFSAQSYRKIYDGTAFDSVITATSCLAAFAMTYRSDYFIRACINALWAHTLFSRTTSIN